MDRILKLSLLADIGGCLVMLLVWTIKDSFGLGLAYGMLTFGNIFLPTFGAVIIYSLLERKMMLGFTLSAILLRIVVLTMIFVFGIFIWAVFDTYFFRTLSWKEINHDYQIEFAGFMPVVFAEAAFIPVLDFFLYKRKNITAN